MAHYAYIDPETNLVVNVIVGRDETELIDGLETEEYYALGSPFYVRRTSYNNKIRKQFAGKGYLYDVVNDVFIAPQPFASWNLDSNFDWQAPIPKPEGDNWYWSEEEGNWLELIS